MRKFGSSVLPPRPSGVTALFGIAMMALASTMPVSGQTNVGVLFGANSSSIGGDSPDDGELTAKTGAIAGLSVEFDMGEGLYLIVQPQFVGRGSGVAFAVEDEPEPRDSLSLSLDYISVPVGLKVVSPTERFYASSVLDLGFLTRANFNDGSSDTDVKDAVNAFDLAIGIGIGTTFSVGGPSMTIELRYSQSILNLPSAEISIGEDGFPRRFRASGMQLVGGLFLNRGGDR